MDREERIPEEHEAKNEETVPTLIFPIKINPGNHPMKSIPLSALPNFHGLASEDPDEFLFEFDILQKSYDYISNTQKMKDFLPTLKGNALRWFMILGCDRIINWNQMKQAFLTKYQEYFKAQDRKEELFKMSQKEDESLEYFMARLEYNVQRSGHPDLDRDI